eukprot:4000093-Pyramimonas_sp.AAC.1
MGTSHSACGCGSCELATWTSSSTFICSRKNAQLLARVDAIANSLGRPIIIACDWDLQPGELNASNFPTLSGAVIRSSKAVACRGGAGNAIIDSFTMITATNRAFSDVRADMPRPKRPHRP